MITELLIAAGAIWLLRQNKSVSGIGAAKRKPRRIWAEVEAAQKAGIDLTDPTGYMHHENELRRMAQGKLSASKSEKPDEQRYFAQLRRAYKSIAGTNLPYRTYNIRNEFGDIILTYNDYELNKLPQTAADYVESEERLSPTDPFGIGYWSTIAEIALGQLKFVWKTNEKKTLRGVESLVFGTSAPKERKLRISYLASPEKGGVYPEKYAHRLWESWLSDMDMSLDDMEILDGVIEAIRTCQSVGQAQQICIDEYLSAHQQQEAPPEEYWAQSDIFDNNPMYDPATVTELPF